jgi:hypothetical protein
MILYAIEENPALIPAKKVQMVNDSNTPNKAYPPGSPLFLKVTKKRIPATKVTRNNNNA